MLSLNRLKVIKFKSVVFANIINYKLTNPHLLLNVGPIKSVRILY